MRTRCLRASVVRQSVAYSRFTHKIYLYLLAFGSGSISNGRLSRFGDPVVSAA